MCISNISVLDLNYIIKRNVCQSFSMLFTREQQNIYCVLSSKILIHVLLHKIIHRRNYENEKQLIRQGNKKTMRCKFFY